MVLPLPKKPRIICIVRNCTTLPSQVPRRACNNRDRNLALRLFRVVDSRRCWSNGFTGSRISGTLLQSQAAVSCAYVSTVEDAGINSGISSSRSLMAQERREKRLQPESAKSTAAARTTVSRRIGCSLASSRFIHLLMQSTTTAFSSLCLVWHIPWAICYSYLTDI